MESSFDLENDPCFQHHHQEGEKKATTISTISAIMTSPCLGHWSRLLTGTVSRRDVSITIDALKPSVQAFKQEEISPSALSRHCETAETTCLWPQGGRFGGRQQSKRAKHGEGNSSYEPVTVRANAENGRPEEFGEDQNSSQAKKWFGIDFIPRQNLKDALPPVQLFGATSLFSGKYFTHFSCLHAPEENLRTAARLRWFPQQQQKNPGQQQQSTPRSLMSEGALTATWLPHVYHPSTDQVESCLHSDLNIVSSSTKFALRVGGAYREVWQRRSTLPATSGWVSFVHFRWKGTIFGGDKKSQSESSTTGNADEGVVAKKLEVLPPSLSGITPTTPPSITPKSFTSLFRPPPLDLVTCVAPVVGSLSNSLYHFVRLSTAGSCTFAEYNRWCTTVRFGLMADILPRSSFAIIPAMEALPFGLASMQLGRSPPPTMTSSSGGGRARGAQSASMTQIEAPIRSLAAINVEINRNRLSCFLGAHATDFLTDEVWTKVVGHSGGASTSPWSPKVGFSMGYALQTGGAGGNSPVAKRGKYTPAKEAGDWRSHSVFRLGGLYPLVGDEMETRVECRYTMDLLEIFGEGSSSGDGSSSGGKSRGSATAAQRLRCGVTWSISDLAD